MFGGERIQELRERRGVLYLRVVTSTVQKKDRATDVTLCVVGTREDLIVRGLNSA